MNPSREKFPAQEIDTPLIVNEDSALELQPSSEGLYNGERKDQVHELPKNPFPTSAQQIVSTITQPLNNKHLSAQGGAPPLNSDEAISEFIERESVAKAKAIIASTQNDPHEESNKISELKIDYLQKKYGKQLKMSEQ